MGSDSTIYSKRFDAARHERGAGYLRLEAELARDAEGRADVLTPALQSDDVAERLLAGVLLDWPARAGEIADALAYFENLPRRIARTPAPTPSPAMVSYHLRERAGGRLDDFFSLRLLKNPEMPYWLAMGVIDRLAETRRPVDCEVLLRFATETSVARLRKAALELATELPGCEVAPSLRPGEERRRTAGPEVPAEVESTTR